MSAVGPRVAKAPSAPTQGLQGVLADTTAVSTVGQHDLGLTYRGYRIEDLTEKCIFEEVAHLLIHHRLPTRPELDALQARFARARALPIPLCDVLERLGPAAHPMDVLRTACSALGCMEPQGERSPEEVCERLMGAFVSSLCYWHHWVTSGRRIRPNTDAHDTLAAAFLKMLHIGRASPEALDLRCVDRAFTLYAEHDFAASTFTARVVASTRSDTYSCIDAAIGALRGPLHGGANEAVMRFLLPLKSPEAGLAKVASMLEKKELVMGFGHRIYKNGDPRNAVFKQMSRELCERPKAHSSGGLYYDISVAIEAFMEKEKRMFPNADFYAASSYYQAGVPISFFTPLFVVARTAGWCAHVCEQTKNSNKIIRPSSLYTGPPVQDVVPIDQRGKPQRSQL